MEKNRTTRKGNKPNKRFISVIINRSMLLNKPQSPSYDYPIYELQQGRYIRGIRVTIKQEALSVLNTLMEIARKSKDGCP